MRGRHMVALGATAALAVGATTVAVGQGTGGTVGPRAQGSLTLQARISERDVGVHCANTNNLRRCRRDENPRLAGIAAGHARIFAGNQRVGTAHFSNIVTQRGRRGRGGDLFFATFILRDGTLTLQGASQGEESAPSSITGGSGAYAGARGYVTEREARGSQREFRVNLTFTFIP